jgi:hypothetical protein
VALQMSLDIYLAISCYQEKSDIEIDLRFDSFKDHFSLRLDFNGNESKRSAIVL